MVLQKTLVSPLDCKGIQPAHLKGDQSWVFIVRTDVEAETPVLWPPDAKSWLLKRPWCWEWLRSVGDGDDRGWDGWMASPTQWTWVWVNFGSWCWTGRPSMLRFMGLQSRTRLNDWTELNHSYKWTSGLVFIKFRIRKCHIVSFDSTRQITWSIWVNSGMWMSNSKYLDQPHLKINLKKDPA